MILHSYDSQDPSQLLPCCFSLNEMDPTNSLSFIVCLLCILRPSLLSNFLYCQTRVDLVLTLSFDSPIGRFAHFVSLFPSKLASAKHSIHNFVSIVARLQVWDFTTRNSTSKTRVRSTNQNEAGVSPASLYYMTQEASQISNPFLQSPFSNSKFESTSTNFHLLKWRQWHCPA